MADLTPEEQRAAFASTFKNTTNLAQRRRYQEQIDQYEADKAAEAQNRYERALGKAELADPLKAEANQMVRIREGRLRSEGIMREDRFLSQQEDAKRRFELQNELAMKKLELDQKKQDIAARKALRDIEIADRIQTQSDRAEQKLFELQNSGIHEGSREWAQASMNIVLENPYLPREMRAQILKGARVDVDPEQIEKYRPLFKNGNLRVTSGPTGDSFTISEAPVPKAPAAAHPEVERTQMLNEYSKMIDIYNKDPGAKPFLEKPIQDMRERLKQFTTPAAPTQPVTPVTPAVSPATPSVSVGAGAATAASASASQTVPVIDDFSSPEYQNLPMGTKFQDSRGNNMIKKGPNDDPLSPDTRRFLDKEKQVIADGLFGSK